MQKDSETNAARRGQEDTMKRIARILLKGLMIVSVVIFVTYPANAQNTISYQAYITDTLGNPYTNTSPGILMRFSLHDSLTGGTELWFETQTVSVNEGVYSVELGSSTPFPPSLDFNAPYFLEVAVDEDNSATFDPGEELSPRQKLTHMPYAMNAETVDGKRAADLDQSAHVARTDNPHGVTASQVNADPAGSSGAVQANLDSHAVDASAHHTKTTSFTDLTDTASDIQLPSTIARDSEITWSNLSGIPAGFADSVDNDSGGDITGITAGTGLVGGGLSGDITLSVQLPMNLTGASSSPLIRSENTGNGWALYGIANGTSSAVYGYNSTTGFMGNLGDIDSGVKGHASGSGYGVYGTHSGGNWGRLGSNLYGVQGLGSGIYSGVYGANSSGNNGTLGSSIHGVYGSSDSGIGVMGVSQTGTAGKFSSTAYGLIVESGKVGIGTSTPSNLLDLKSMTGGIYMGIDFATDKNAGINFMEDGVTRWIFPFFRGWQSDNLHVHDQIGGLDVMTFESGTGRVGIGTVSPKQRLHNSGDYYGRGHLWLYAYQGDGSSGTAFIQARDDSGTSSIDLQLRSQDAGAPVDALKIMSTGEVGIGTPSPSERLEVNGNVRVNGSIIWPAKTGYLSVPPAVFTAESGGANYLNTGHSIGSSDLFSPQDFYAPVNLPHGSVVTQLVTFWYDESVHDATLSLRVRPLTNACAASVFSDMGSVLTTWNSPARQSRADTTISYATIDNVNCTYFLELTLPPVSDPLILYDIVLIGTRIDYTYTEN